MSRRIWDTKVALFPRGCLFLSHLRHQLFLQRSLGPITEKHQRVEKREGKKISPLETLNIITTHWSQARHQLPCLLSKRALKKPYLSQSFKPNSLAVKGFTQEIYIFLRTIRWILLLIKVRSWQHWLEQGWVWASQVPTHRAVPEILQRDLQHLLLFQAQFFAGLKLMHQIVCMCGRRGWWAKRSLMWMKV